jgi:uncharacterized protein (TIGR02145 family)
MLVSVAVTAILAVMLSGCGGDSGANSGGGGGGNNSGINVTDDDGAYFEYVGQTYKTVTIGGKRWMAENLNYQPSSGNSWCYNNKPDSCVKYGRLYDWNTAKKVCPKGWHLPTRSEWDELMTAVGDSLTAGKKLKSTSGWSDFQGKSGNGTDDFGFSALPGGFYYYYGGSFSNTGNIGYWWTATEYPDGSAYCRFMYYYNDFVYEYYYVKSLGYSVRCRED